MSTLGTYGNPMSMGMYGMNGMNMGPAFQGGYAGYDTAKGKGKSREADFEAAFAQLDASISTQAETSRIVEVDDSVTDIEEALKATSIEPGTDFKRSVALLIHLQTSFFNLA